jgi:predicted AlkP superfamily pyrophosphatase or phosphodiesterase
MRRSMLGFVLLLALAFDAAAEIAPPPPFPLPARPERPRLCVLIVVDQLCADALERFAPYLTEQGFRRLAREGAVFAFARHRHATTQTGPGHATIATGAYPDQHGIVGNRWIDREIGRAVYCVEDPACGRSPRSLCSTTFGDELVMASGGNSRVVALSMKDRAAILLAGRLGRAYWWEPSSGSFSTSAFYLQGASLPPEIAAWNAQRPLERYRGRPWERALPESAYLFLGPDDRPFERDVPFLGRAFPHRLPGAGAPVADLGRAIVATPFSNELLADLARTVLRAEGLGGREGATDVLAVSFSAHDRIGHLWGPDSHESFDETVRLDRSIADLLGAIDAAAGGRAIVALTADHGGAPPPEASRARGFDAGRLDPKAIAACAEAALDRAFGADGWTIGFEFPGLYLDPRKLAAHGLAPEAAERVAAEALRGMPGIAFAFPRTDLARGAVPPSDLGRAVSLAFDARRSGDVTVVAAPFWYLDEDPEEAAATHGTPYAYDQHVPLILRGPGVRPGRYDRPVSVADLAPTLALLLGAPLTSGCEGAPLAEAIEGR